MGILPVRMKNVIGPLERQNFVRTSVWVDWQRRVGSLEIDEVRGRKDTVKLFIQCRRYKWLSGQHSFPNALLRF